MKGLFQVPTRRRTLLQSLALTGLAGAALHVHGAEAAKGRSVEHVLLTNGFDLVCDRREQVGDRMRLYTEPGSPNFVEVPASEVASVEIVALPPAPVSVPVDHVPTAHADLNPSELHELLATAGTRHNLDVNLLASVVRAESGGHARAVSNKGAQGLMQLMPKTAAELGVNDTLEPDQNIAGGATYLDSLLTRYHENLALALAAYNAGPGAVDRWHGVPPYRETRLYVARIIRDFNASVKAARRAEQSKTAIAQADSAHALLSGAVAP